MKGTYDNLTASPDRFFLLLLKLYVSAANSFYGWKKVIIAFYSIFHYFYLIFQNDYDTFHP